jgi:hypothetical protein
MLILDKQDTGAVSCLLSSLNSLIFDYLVKQKVGGAHLNFFVLKQLPVLPLERYHIEDVRFIVPRVIELVYTAWDIKSFADDLWRDTDETIHILIEEQSQKNRITTGDNEFEPSEWEEVADGGVPIPPFRWDEQRRALLRAELDAYYARMYGLTQDELRHILDPKEVYGEDFPGETFRVLKEKEIRQFGEYRTRRLVLEAWDRLNES